MKTEREKYQQALNKQKFSNSGEAVIKVRRLYNSYKVVTKSGKIYHWKVEEASKLFPLVVVE